MTRCAIPALRRGQGKDKAIQGTLKGWMFRRRHQMKPESSNGIRNRDFKEQLRLGSVRTFGRIFRKAFALEIVKQNRAFSQYFKSE
jgi:hypothetical protein